MFVNVVPLARSRLPNTLSAPAALVTASVPVPVICRVLAIPLWPTFRMLDAPVRSSVPALVIVMAEAVAILSVPPTFAVPLLENAPVIVLAPPLMFNVPDVLVNEDRLTSPVNVEAVDELFVKLVPVKVRPVAT